MTKAKYDFVACQSFAGGFDMGMTQAGFRLIHKVEQKGGFGMANCEANRGVLGNAWTSQVGDAAEWEAPSAPVVVGNPPCSGFSLLSRKDFRGPDSPVNSCMWVFAEYVARVRPQIAIFESVQQAYKQGLSLMRDLRDRVEYETGEQWTLHHVLHNNASVGGSAIRKRYFWLISRIPFGVDEPAVKRVPHLRDVIGDLEGLAMTWERQPYRRPPSWWSAPRRSSDHGVDGHVARDTPAIRRALDLLDGTHWGIKEIISTVARRYYETHGKLPDSWYKNEEKLVGNDFRMGYNQMTRWHPDKMARVITGGALDLVMHPHEDRAITHREAARIQGFPDDWRVRPLRGTSGLHMTWGRGIPADCGKWIGEWIMQALDGEPGSWAGEPMEREREFEIDVTNAYRAVCNER